MAARTPGDEPGFLNDPDDARLLRRAAYRARVCRHCGHELVWHQLALVCEDCDGLPETNTWDDDAEWERLL